MKRALRLGLPVVLGSVAGFSLSDEQESLLANLAEDAIGLQNPRGDAVALTHQPEEHMLGSNMVMAKSLRLVDGQGKHSPNAWRIVKLTLGWLIEEVPVGWLIEDVSDGLAYLIKFNPQSA